MLTRTRQSSNFLLFLEWEARFSKIDSPARLTRCRLVERGVRIVQVYPAGQRWDNHTNIGKSLPNICRATDKPVAGLLADLKQRGLMDEVLVVWGGEFGRLPIAQIRRGTDPKRAGRDHGGTRARGLGSSGTPRRSGCCARRQSRSVTLQPVLREPGSHR